MYQTYDSYLSKIPKTYDVVGDRLKFMETEITISSINNIHIYKRFDGYWFGKISHVKGIIPISSHSACGFGKQPENKSIEFKEILLKIIDSKYFTGSIHSGSSVWKFFGVFTVFLSILCLVALLMSLFQVFKSDGSLKIGKLLCGVFIGFFGYRMIKNGGRDLLDKEKAKSLLMTP